MGRPGDPGAEQRRVGGDADDDDQADMAVGESLSDYEEPKKLAARGLAAAQAGRVGKRRRTTYSVTPAGSQALARWLAVPGGPPVLGFEALLKVFFAEFGTKEGLQATPAAVQEWAAEETRQWPEDVRDATPNRDALREIADRETT